MGAPSDLFPSIRTRRDLPRHGTGGCTLVDVDRLAPRAGRALISSPLLRGHGLWSNGVHAPHDPDDAVHGAARSACDCRDRRRGRQTRARSGTDWNARVRACDRRGVDSAARAIGLDRLLARRDSRAVAADVVHERDFPRGASIFQNATLYGRVEPWPEGLYPQLPLDRSPRLAIVHTSRLVAYSSEPAGMREILQAHYRLLRRIDVENHSSTATPIFDQQDAFFTLVAGFDRFERPGPTIEISYERVDQ